MPTNNGLGLNNDQSSPPSRPEALKHNPGGIGQSSENVARAMSRENLNPLPQSQVFQEKMMT
jgi:hypothetical protein